VEFWITALFTVLGRYSSINSTKSPVSGAGNVSEPKLMSWVRRVHEFVWAYIGGFRQSCGGVASIRLLT